MNFAFYDTETTGLDTTYDQILQFAAILTDSDFNELDRFELRCRIQPHITPSPEALLATRVSPNMLTDPKLPSHYQFIHKIAETLNKWAPAIFLGYNTINFDEPLLRQAFYQTLHPIYLTNTGGNQRGDVFRLVQATSLLRPDVIIIPKNKTGNPILKLDMLAPANGFAHENAHDALADVEATIHIAKLVRKRAPNIWKALMPLVTKAEVIHRINNELVNCLIENKKGRASMRAIVSCCDDLVDFTLTAVFDLEYEPENYINLSIDELVSVMNGPKKAIRTIYANQMPAILPFDFIKKPEQKFKLSLSEIQRRAVCINKATDFHERVSRALKLRFPNKVPSKIIEERIYEGFPSRNDQDLMKKFHSASPLEQLDLINSFEDERYQEIGRRIMFLENPTVITDDLRSKLEKWVNNRKNGRSGVSSGRTIPEACVTIDGLDEKMPKHKKQIAEIRRWLSIQMMA